MHHRRRVGHEGPAVTQVRHQGDHLHVVHDLLGSFESPLEAKSEKGPGALGAVLVNHRVVRVAFQPGVAAGLDLLVTSQELSNSHRVRAMLLDAQRQSLNSGVNQESVHRRHARASVTQPQRPRRDSKRHPGLTLCPEHLSHRSVLAKHIVEHHPVIRSAGLGENRELFWAGPPVKITLLHDSATQRVAVAVHELGQAVDDDVRAVLEGSAQVGGGAGVVDDEGQALGMGNVGDLLDVHHQALGVGDRLAVHRLGLVVNSRLNGSIVIHSAEPSLPAELFEESIELGDGPAVELVGGDEIIPPAHQVTESQVLGRVA
mmetsp:Transcript_3850/g.8552  ORF Transcript_3850/g.8552 Transcript_3850/m.8552 type:complete len:317 (+) Transcript_3850:714-1664(+)